MRPNLVQRLLFFGPAAAAVLLAASVAAAAPATATATEPWDPWEKMNRRFFAIEAVLDPHFLEPITHTFSKAPRPLRKALRNFNRHLREPVAAVDDLLQGRIRAPAPAARPVPLQRL